MSTANPIGAIVLAAGASTRMGTPKQLLPYRGRSLLRHAAVTALEGGLSPVIVVLGCQAQRLQEELDGLAVTTVVNPHWQTGMGSSLRVGLAALVQQEPALEGVVVMLCDQPRVEASFLTQLAQGHAATGKPLVAAAYADTLGVPAFFARSLFPQLERLADHEGARRIIADRGDTVLALPCAEAAHDLDTPDDYRNLATCPSFERSRPHVHGLGLG